MKKNDLMYQWPPSIHTYEQKFYGFNMMSFLGGGIVAVMCFVVCTIAFSGITGMIIGAVFAFIAFVAVVAASTKMESFNGETIPVYMFKRFWGSRHPVIMSLPLIASSDMSGGTVVIEDWDGGVQGVLE